MIKWSSCSPKQSKRKLDYKEYVRTLPCLICGRGGVDPAHLKAVGAGRKRELPKWEDFTIIPLSHEYHQELHYIGMTKFEKKYQINLYKEALTILAKWIFNETNKN